MKLLKTDKNGTQYWQDDKCDKCFGRGYINEYDHVEGGICFKCNGSGFHIRNWKIYTPEYATKLDRQREAREARKLAKFELELPEHYKAAGLSADGRCWVVVDRTFARKDELKASGAKFNGAWWYFAAKPECWDTEEIDGTQFVEADPHKGRVSWPKEPTERMKSVVPSILKARRTEKNLGIESFFYGQPGDKVETLVELKRVFHFESTDFRGNPCTKFGYKMEDGNGHHFVWVTDKSAPELLIEIDHCWHCDGIQQQRNAEGRRFTLKGTVKAHQEREGIKETRLTRCKFIEA